MKFRSRVMEDRVAIVLEGVLNAAHYCQVIVDKSVDIVILRFCSSLLEGLDIYCEST